MRLLRHGGCVHAFEVSARNAVEALEQAHLTDLLEGLDAEEIAVEQIEEAP